MKSRVATAFTWLGYAMCNAGVSLGTMPFQLILLYYLTQIAGLPAGLAGIVIALPKIWDALIDPMFGGWIDRYSVRIGRRTPAIAVSTLVFLGSLVAIFAMPTGLPVWQTATIIFVLLVISSIAQTGIGVSQFAIAPEMSKGPVELSSLLAIAAVTAQLISVAGSFAVPLLIGSGGGQAGYTYMAVVIALAAGLAFCLFMLGTRKVPVRTAVANEESLPTLQSLRKTIQNGAFYNLLGLVVCLNVSIALMFAFLPFANQYILNGGHAVLALLEGVLAITVLLGLMAAPLMARFINPLKAMLIANIVSALGMASLLTAGSVPLWATLVQLAAIGLGSGVVGILIQTSILGAAQRTLRDGSVVALGFYLGIMVAAIKLGASAGALVSGQLLHAFGFVSGAAQQSETAILGLKLGYSVVPALFVLASILFLLRNIAGEKRRLPDEAARTAG